MGVNMAVECEECRGAVWTEAGHFRFTYGRPRVRASQACFGSISSAHSQKSRRGTRIGTIERSFAVGDLCARMSVEHAWSIWGSRSFVAVFDFHHDCFCLCIINTCIPRVGTVGLDIGGRYLDTQSRVDLDGFGVNQRCEGAEHFRFTHGRYVCGAPKSRTVFFAGQHSH